MTPTPEELLERGRAVVLELDYWKQVNDLLLEQTDAIAEVAAAIAEVTVAGVSTAAFGDPRVTGFVSDTIESAGRAMRSLSQLQTASSAIGDLVSGRLRVLAVAVGELREGAA